MPIILQVGPPRLRLQDDPFRALVSSILSQQLAVKAAETIIGRCSDLDVIRRISRAPRGDHDIPQKPITILRVRLGWDSIALPGAENAPPKKKSTVPMQRYAVPIQNSPFDGPRDAPVTIVAFLDAGEPYSGKLFPALEQMLNLYPDRVRVVYKFHEIFPKRASRIAQSSRSSGATSRRYASTGVS